MGTVFTVLLVLLALSSIVLTMWFVMREKREHDAHTRYRRSPWAEEPVRLANHETVVETHDEPVTVVMPEAGAHTPLTEHVVPDDETKS